MGAKTGILVYADGDVRAALRRAGTPDRAATTALVRRLRPDWPMEPVDGERLYEGTYPPKGVAYAGAFPGVDIICDRRLMVAPSQLPEHLVEAGRGRTMVLHAMHSVSDWLAFAVWRDGQLVRSLCLAPDGGIGENLGDPFAFEAPYWAGEHPVEPMDADDPPYPLPFHPLELGEEALRALVGFVLEGWPEPDDIDAERVELHGYRLADPAVPARSAAMAAPARTAAMAAAVEQMLRTGPRRYEFGPDGRLVEQPHDAS